MELALGTAQFGLDYGVSNTAGKVPADEAGRILAFCRDNGITTLDTAQAYGDAEQVLGRFDLSPFKVVTKTGKDGRIEDSLDRLRVPRLEAVLLHREDEFDDEAWRRLQDARRRGIVRKIGVSVYFPDRLRAIAARYPIDVVQLPLNLLDQRFLPQLEELKAKGVEIHARSAFLQGLLLMEPGGLDPYFDPIKPVLARVPAPKLVSALAFVKGQSAVDKVVVGVTSLSELREILAGCRTAATETDWSGYSVNEERFLVPSLWKRT